MKPFAIQTRALTKTYGLGRAKKSVVDNLDLHVPEGSIYGLLGRNSAGKTTTIRMLMGLARPTSGSLQVLGLNPAEDPSRVEVLRQVGFVPEDKTLIGSTPRKLFAVNREFYRHTWSDALAQKVADRLELPVDDPFLKLSLGNKTKAALVVAIAQRSRLLILDEPTTGLDPVALDALLRLLVEDCTADGRTVFLSTHQLAEIEQIADHIGIMDGGRLLLEGPLDDLRASFLRITATGVDLPQSGPNILHAFHNRHATQYVLQRDPAAFLAQLTSQGAIVVDQAPLSLNDIFLELCRKAEAVPESESEARA